MTEAVKPLSVQEVRERLNVAFTVDLPSGIGKVQVKRMTVYDYIKEGVTDIPNEFYAFVANLNQGRVDEALTEEQKAKNLEMAERFLAITLERGCVEPKVMFKYDPEKKDTHLIFSELSVKDQAAIINAILGK